MKSKNFIVNGLFALFLVAAFAQCDGNNAANTPASNSTPTAGTSELKIAYVEIDSLLNNYNLCKDLNEAMIKKQENVEVTLKEKMKSLDSECVTLSVNIKIMCSLRRGHSRSRTDY